jgi:hypothetical protein
VYEKYEDGKYARGQLDLKAGPIQLEWSRGGNESGWVYYDPPSMRVWYVDATDSETLVKALAVTDRVAETGKQ